MTHSPKTVIHFSHVTARYAKSEAPAISDLNFSVEKGALTVLLGGGGTGKTTIFRLLTAEIAPSEGEVLFCGASLSLLQGKKLALHRRSLGLLSQDLTLLDDRTVAENLALPLEIEGMKSSRREERIKSVLDRYGLTSTRDALPSDLSMSERQRATVARSVVAEPLVLLADEPAAHLDERSAREIADLLLRENLRGMTVLIGTYDERFAAMFRDASVVRL